MKIRADFVSNSSSSSFILANDPVFYHFDITKQDIFDALVEIYGKDKYIKYIEDRKNTMKEHPDWYSDESKYANHGPFYIYDMTIEADRNEAFERWGEMLDDWDATNCELDYKTGLLGWKNHGSEYENICESIRKLYDINGFYHGALDENSTMFVRTKNRQPNGTYGVDVKVPEYVVKFVNETRKFAGICTNLQVLKNKLSRFFIHYDDNELWSSQFDIPEKDHEDEEKWDVDDEDLAIRLGRGYFPNEGKNSSKDEIIARGKISIKDHNEYADKRNKMRDESIYESEPYSMDRVFEVLFNKLVERGKIKPDDSEFLGEYYSLKENYRCEDRYETENGENYSWEDLKDSCLTFVGHEG